MSFLHLPALALAAAILDATIGYPAALARAIGSPVSWMAKWLAIVEGATERKGGGRALAIYLAPIVIAAAVLSLVLPAGPLGFAATALLASTLCGRQALDTRARALALTWENDGAYEALEVAEALGPSETEMRLTRASAAAIAARFADEVVGPTIFILIGGLTGAAFCRGLGLVSRACRDRRDASPFGRLVARLEGWLFTPVARVAAGWIAAAAWLTRRRDVFDTVWRPASTPTSPAEAAMLAAIGDPQRDDPAYVRLAIGMFRRAAALEFVALAVLALAFAALG
jgi:cobalamin biosynthesis protein CobD/CbiB